MPTTFPELRDDDFVVLALCSSLVDASASARMKPLSPTAFTELGRRLRQACPEAGLAHLHSLEPQQWCALLGYSPEDADALRARLAAASKLSLALDRLHDRGIAVVTRLHEAYPARLKARLRAAAPPVLFACGPLEVAQRPSVAIVGSRNADDAALAFTAELATAVTRHGYAVVSGGARGVDGAAMTAAYEAGGVVVGFVADDLVRAARMAHEPIESGSAVLLSDVAPGVGFSVGRAMGRNRLIYAAAEAAFVVHCDERKGGTWTGATDALSSEWGVPVWVRGGEDGVPAGNQALTERGAHEWTGPIRAEDVPALCDAPAPTSAHDNSTPICLNRASVHELERLDGIGPKTAELIVAARPFRNVEQVRDIKGIGSKLFERIRHRITVSDNDDAPKQSDTRNLFDALPQ